MEYKKIISLLNNKSNQPTKFRIKNWVKINDESRGIYDKENQIRFKTSLPRSDLFAYGDTYTLFKRTKTAAKETDAAANNDNKKVIFKNCAPFTTCISRINNSQDDNAQTIDVVMPMYNLIEYNGNCWKTSGTLWQHCRDEPDLAADNAITDFIEANVITDSFKRKEIIKGQTGDNGIKNMEIKNH